MLCKSIQLILRVCQKQIFEFCIEKGLNDVLFQCGLFVIYLIVYWRFLCIDVLVTHVNFVKQLGLLLKGLFSTFQIAVIVSEVVHQDLSLLERILEVGL